MPHLRLIINIARIAWFAAIWKWMAIICNYVGLYNAENNCLWYS